MVQCYFTRNQCKIQCPNNQNSESFRLRRERAHPPPAPTPYGQHAGLSSKRQWYLYEKIREFCPENFKDVTCPRPSAPLESSSPSCSPSPAPPPPSSSTPLPTGTTAATATATTSTSTATTTDVDEPPAKRARLCGACRQPGHNARTCPN